MLQLRLLGEVEVLLNGERLTLPPSRKTRALLAYLASTGRPQRRERLCSMFWEVPDDPRGALRWSVSRLRSVVDEPGRTRIVADRETVAFSPEGADIDLAAVRALAAGGISALSTEQIEEAAARFRGEFLEGLDLPNQHDFQSWCVAEREDLRRLQVALLTELVERQGQDAAAALPAARQLVQVDPFNEDARAELLRLLVESGRRQEAESHFETAVRLYRDVGQDLVDRLAKAWRQMRRTRPDAPPAEDQRATASPSPERAPPAAAESGGLVGREEELRRLLAAVETSKRERQVQVVALLGEPGIGKSRVVQELANQASGRGVRVLIGRSYDAKLRAAFGPWIEALGAFPLLDDAESSLLGRERLFAAVTARIIDDDGAATLLALEDIHWADEASADLLHHVVRAARHRALTVVVTAREGELPDNRPVSAVFRSLRRDTLWDEVRLDPLTEKDMQALVRAAAPAAETGHVIELSGGNPLYALEIVRNLAENADALPRPLKELVRDRVERIAPEAADLLRWASVIGPTVDVERLGRVAEVDLAALTRTLELLERHAMLAPVDHGAGRGSYVFSHELVRQAIYTGLSEPRRRLMHLKVAQLLNAASRGIGGEAMEIAHHAAAGGDARMAAEACVAAGRHCMRLFAHAEAFRLSRQGQSYAAALPDPVRTECMVELAEIEAGVSRPADPASLVARVEALAENALDHGRPDLAGRCYIMLANLRWEGGAWSDARRDMLRVELVSRASDDRERILALAEASRCLAMLERDLGTSEALVLEAEAISRRVGYEPNAIADASGLLRCYRGEFAEAVALFQRARVIARRDGDRGNEFLASEHLLTLEIERDRFRPAAELCAEVVELAGKIRSGSELPFANALQALCRFAGGDDEAMGHFEAALADLRNVDSKHRLAFAANSGAKLLLARGETGRARGLAEEALAAATLLDRQSDMAAALSVLAQIAAREGDLSGQTAHLDRLGEVLAGGVSANARRAADEAMALATAAQVQAVGV